MKLGRILPMAVGVAVVLAVGGYVVMGKQQEQQQRSKRARAFQDQPAPVLAARASTADVPVYLDAVGNTRALNTVTVRAQVGGQIVKIAFREGQDVKRGDVLAEIDPRTYQAQYDVRRSPRRRRTRRRSPTRGSTSIATPGSRPRIPDRSSRPTPRGRWWRSSRRRCRAIRRRSTTRARC